MTPDPPPGFFRLEVLQQPRFARACGSGDKDRRQVDPPPVIKLHFGPEALPGDKNPAMHYILLCELTDESGTVNVTNRSGIESELVGNRTVQSYNFAGRDPPLDGTFFAFPDLSVRSVGRYRLNFKLIRLPQLAPQEGDLALQPTSVHTDIFQVYPAKDFPGMLESTELTKALAEAGMPISLKKGHERRESEREKDGDR